MAAAVQIFKDNMIKNEEMVAKQKRQEEETRQREEAERQRKEKEKEQERQREPPAGMCAEFAAGGRSVGRALRFALIL